MIRFPSCNRRVLHAERVIVVDILWDGRVGELDAARSIGEDALSFSGGINAAYENGNTVGAVPASDITTNSQECR